MLAQPTEDEGVVLERPSETQPIPSSSHPSEDPIEPHPDPSLRPSSSNPIPDSIPKGSGGNYGGQSSSDRSLSGNEDGLTLQKCLHEEKIGKEEVLDEKVNTEGIWEDKQTLELSLSGDTMVLEEKESEEKGVSTEDPVSTAQPKVSTDKPKVSTDKPKVSIDKDDECIVEPKDVSTDKDDEGTAEPKDGNSDESATPKMTSTPTPTVFGDVETIAQVLITMSQNKVKRKEKEKGVEIKDTEDADRPRTKIERSILTLKPLPKIDPKAKGKKKSQRKMMNSGRIKKSGSFRAGYSMKTVEFINKLMSLEAKKQASYKKSAEKPNDDILEACSDKLIENMNKKAAGMDKEEVAKELESSKVEGPNENINKRSGRRLKMKALKRSKRQKTDSDHEEDNQIRTFLKIVPEEEENIDYEVLGTRYPIINWESKIYDYGHFGRELIYYRVFRADGSSRWIKTFSEMIKLFDRIDLIEIHSLVMKRFETTPLEGINLLLWGDLRTMFESKKDDELWKNQEEWKL
ncbi:hypothetical protein Tco_1470599, partial [Tanacetum coccineum]